MSDDTRMMLLHHSTSDLIEELLMWKSLAAEHSDRIAELEEFIDQLIEAGNELTANPTVGNYEEREATWTKLWLKWKARND